MAFGLVRSRFANPSMKLIPAQPSPTWLLKSHSTVVP
jgi:hypothetical protein